jgi:hypothetical protein
MFPCLGVGGRGADVRPEQIRVRCPGGEVVVGSAVESAEALVQPVLRRADDRKPDACCVWAGACCSIAMELE